MHLQYRMIVVVLLAVVALMGTIRFPPVLASLCQVGNIHYNYPQQVTGGVRFGTTTTVTVVCAPDDANYYSIRVDLNDQLFRVLSDSSAPIGYSQGQSWNVSVSNQVTPSMLIGSWQIIFAVYVFAAIGSGDTLDSVTINPVRIQVGAQ